MQANPRILDNNKDWQPWRGGSRGYDLGFRITDAGTARLTITDGDGFGEFYWLRPVVPPRQGTEADNPKDVWPSATGAEQVINPNALMNNVKRVVAMTRETNHRHELDGAYLIFTFSKGKLITPDKPNGEDWTWQKTNQTPTGYDTPGSESGGGDGYAIDALNGGRRSTLSRYKVDFPRLDGATHDGELFRLGRGRDSYKQTENGKSRYNQETVRINLRTFTSVSGTGITRWPNP